MNRLLASPDNAVPVSLPPQHTADGERCAIWRSHTAQCDCPRPTTDRAEEDPWTT